MKKDSTKSLDNNKFKSSESKFKISFFDEFETKQFKLWSPFDPSILIGQEQSIEGMLLRLSRKKDQLKEKTYLIINDLLVQKPTKQGQPYKYLKLSNASIEKIKYQEKPGFRIIKNLKNFDCIVQSDQIFHIWMKSFKQFCIQKSFHHDFSLIKMIGKGNFAKVYSATNKATNKMVAIKAFEKEKFTDISIDKPALIKELSIMRLMNHRGVIKLYEVYENETHIFFICEILEGGELFHHMKQHKHYDEQTVVHIMHSILQAIEYIHSKNVLHRDIKPENLILRSKDDFKDVCIADFGLADYYDPKGNYMFKRCGTPGYVAPELLQDKLYDFKIDIFSAGVLMFIMLTGSSPFRAKSYNEIVMKNYNCEIDFDLLTAKNVSKEANKLLHDLLDKKPIQRPTATQALQYDWFRMNGLKNEFCFDGNYMQFDPNDNKELYAKTPLMNQELNMSITSTPYSATPQIRSKSNTTNNEIRSKSNTSNNNEVRSKSNTQDDQFQQQLSQIPMGTISPDKNSSKYLNQQQVIKEEQDYNVNQEDENPQSKEIKRYQMNTKMIKNNGVNEEKKINFAGKKY